MPEERKYEISAFAYLKRARKQLRSNNPASIFYAALELRCAIEARARKQIYSLGGISKKTIQLWHAAKIMDEMEKRINGAKDDLAFKFNFKQKSRGGPLTYKPINKEILAEYGKLGDLLHAQNNEVSSEFIRNKKEWLVPLLEKVTERCMGHMLKPPEIKIKCSQCKKYLKWGTDRSSSILCSCWHKNYLINKELKGIITVRKKSKRIVEILQLESLEELN